MWVRGLKHVRKSNKREVIESHPMWVRGLKHVDGYTLSKHFRRILCGCVD